VLEMLKTAVAFDEADISIMEEIIARSDEKEALSFIKISVYRRLTNIQRK
jgi:hypothetical protein